MRYIVLLLLLPQTYLGAQTASNLVAWLTMGDAVCEIKDQFGDPGVIVFPNGTVDCACGVTGNGLYFAGGNQDNVFLVGPSVDNVIGSIDFTLSFYFKPDGRNVSNATPHVLFSKRDNCSQDSSFIVKYFPGGSRQLSIEIYESQTSSTTLFASLPFTCWHHIAIVRKGPEIILYHNGVELKRAGNISGQRVRVSPEYNLIIGGSDCPTDKGFRGMMDEVRLYNRALTRQEVEDLYLFPDNIANGLRFNDLKDTTIFLGGSVPIQLTETCADMFSWFPTLGVDDPSSATPTITPDVTTTYMVEMEDSLCQLTDSIHIIVINPDSVKCGDIFLPTAFTPNEDGLNDKFGISNPFSTGEILAFDIYDRWGNIVFSTTNVLEKWDGSFRGTPVNPGVFLYKLLYRCEGVEDLLSGSVTVIR